MAGRRKPEIGIMDDGVAVEAAAPVSTDTVKVGDVVIYNQRPMTMEPNVPAMFPAPMMVTAVNASGTVNGVLMSDNAHLGFMGVKVVRDAPSGEGPGEWHKRT